ncbi:hypothetical protein [Paenibacillus endoradicis]|uniref:hypothetical protein n=1 Tax=Paenibacillus endoradicis TaxID=2972487 RepID=UPI002158CB67|nr:hypothetical protein [Paenibacillus endoradicis]MCR8656387.1 hypothetical protein [Paenibacillus endoradicis]
MELKRIKIVHLFVMVIVLLSGVMVGEHKSAYACSCAVGPGSFEDELADSDYVFDGVVTDKKEESSFLGFKSSDEPVEWTFQVNGSWKGEVTEIMQVTSAQSSASCGYEFKVGKRYAVFASEADGTIKVTSCSKTLIIADNSDIFTELGSYKDEFNVPPIDDLVEEIVGDPNSSVAHNPRTINEEGDNTVTQITITDQNGALYSEETTQKDSIEKVNENGIITFVVVLLLFIMLTGMLIYRKRRN